MPDHIRILYVEDNPVDFELVRVALAGAVPPIETARADGVAQALGLLREGGRSRYSAVLTDMLLPDGSGLDILGFIGREDIGLPVVVVTGAGDDRTVIAALKAGADDYVLKRDDFLARLPATLVGAIDRHRDESGRVGSPLSVLYLETDARDADATRRHIVHHAPHIALTHIAEAAELRGRLAAAQGGRGFDVLLLDYRPVGATALDLVKELREVHGLQVPVVLVTSHGNEEVALRAIRLGISDYLVKSPGYLHQLPWVLEHARDRAALARERVRLAGAQQRFLDVVEASGEFIWETDAEWRFTFVSERSVETAGLAPADLIGHRPGRYIPEAERERVFARFQAAVRADGSFREFEVRFRDAAGGDRWLLASGAPIRDGEGAVVGYRGTCSDITARKRSEFAAAALRERLVTQNAALLSLSRSSALQRADAEAAIPEILETAARVLGIGRVSVWLLDESQDSLACRHLYETAGGRRAAGGTLARSGLPSYLGALVEGRVMAVEDVAVDARVNEIATDYLAPLGIGALLDAPIRVNGSFAGVLCHEHLGGVRAWHEDESRFAASMADFAARVIEGAQRRSVEEALRAREVQRMAELREKDERLRLAMGIARIIEWDWDIDRDVLAWGEDPTWVLGPPLTGGERRYPDFRFMVHPDDRDRFLAAGQRCIAEGGPYYAEARIVTTDGHVRWVATRGRGIPDAGGRVVRMVGMMQDITERKQAEDDLARLNAELERRVSERTLELQDVNRELEAFSYTVAHDLRAPLRAIAGWAKVLQGGSDAAGHPEAPRAVESIARNAQQMETLIDDLLDFSRLGRTPVRRRSHDLRALVNECVADLRPDTEGRDVRFVVGELGSARIDAGLFRHVYMNLLANAVKFTRGRAPAVIEVGRTIEAGVPVYWVSDNGVGYDPAYQDRLFRVFQRLHRQEEFEGTGIGLATVLRIIERHEGRIWSRSDGATGATFSFTIGA